MGTTCGCIPRARGPCALRALRTAPTPQNASAVAAEPRRAATPLPILLRPSARSCVAS